MKAPWFPLGEVLELQRRRVVIDPQRNYVEVGLRSFGRGVFHKDPLPGLSLGDKRVFNICAGDLLVSNVFGWEGAVAVAEDSEAGLVGSHRFMTWTPKAASIDVAYVAHFLLSDDGMVELRRASPGSAGRNRTLSIKNFEAIQVPLPVIDDQRRIAARLAAVARHAADVPDRMQLERWTNGLLGRLVQGAEGEVRPLGELLRRCREWQTIDHLRTYTPIGVRGFGRGLFHYPPVPGSGLGRLRYAALGRERLVVSNIKAWEGAVAVTSTADESCVASNRFLQYEATVRDVTVDYIRHYLVSPPGLAQLQNASPGSADRNRTLSMDSFEAITIPVPSRLAQDRITRSMRLAARVAELADRRAILVSALLPAARNEVFSQLR